MLLINSTPGVEQNNPHLIPGQLKEEFLVANTRSHAIESWNPAAAAIPFTAHKVGIDNDLNLSMRLAQRSKIYPGFLDA